MPLPQLSFFIVEDEKAAQKALTDALQAYSNTNTLGVADNVEDAYAGILDTDPDALFLDIKLRGGDAFHLMQKFKDHHIDCPPCIVMTGHDEFELAQRAINDFKDKIIKILKKPFWSDFDEHFQQCRDAIYAYHKAADRPRDPDVLFIKEGPVTYRLEYKDIDFVEVGGNGTVFLSTSPRLEESKKINTTLSRFLEQAPDRFLRIHRNCAVQVSRISHINHEEHMLYLQGHDRGLSIGRSYYPLLLRLFS